MHNADTVLDKAPGQEAFSTVLCCDCRNFIKSPVCLEEFLLGYDQVSLFGRKQHLIVLVVDKPEPGMLPPQLENYLARNTYIEAHNFVHEMETIREKIRVAMPNISLKQLTLAKEHASQNTPDGDIEARQQLVGHNIQQLHDAAPAADTIPNVELPADVRDEMDQESED